ncbi:IS200/IS605 family transposase [Parabacteroides goldsteinii]|uniref:IS200/IS605 family transposase n=1 Tax=Bacteroidales TaxID=171549 RepID=UPI00260646C1|nr:IS200/IS605 family transposase [Parabacteroides goldsteinii]
MDNNSLSHTTWNCKYHIVFASKYRRKIIYSELKQDIANILSMLCKHKEVNIVEAEICLDHVHMLVEIPPKMRYYVDTVGKNAKKIEEYIRNQLEEDLEYDQMSLKEYIDPFTGEPVNKSKKK